MLVHASFLNRGPNQMSKANARQVARGLASLAFVGKQIFAVSPLSFRKQISTSSGVRPSIRFLQPTKGIKRSLKMARALVLAIKQVRQGP